MGQASSLRHRCCNLVVIFLLSSAAALGQSSATPSGPAESGLATLSDGTVSGNSYYNADLGFRYEFPAGWNVNDKATQARSVADQRQFVWADDGEPNSKSKPATICSKALLVVTLHPQGMLLNTEFNPLALLLAADPKCAPSVSFPSNAKDKDAIKRMAANLGIFFKLTPSSYPIPGNIRAFDAGGRTMVEVAQSFKVSSRRPGESATQMIRTSVWIMQAGKYWVMAMLAAGNDTDLQKLRASKVFFDSPPQ
jgi:hypothetical protein